LSKQFILCLFQFENCVFRSESVAKSDKLSYNEKRKRGIFLLLFWRRSSKVRIGVYFYERTRKNKSGTGGSRRILSATLEALSGEKGGYDSGRHGG